MALGSAQTGAPDELAASRGTELPHPVDGPGELERLLLLQPVDVSFLEPPQLLSEDCSVEVPQPLVLVDGPLGAPQPSAFFDLLFDLDRLDSSVDEFPEPAFFGSVVDPHPADPLSQVESVGFPQPELFFDASDGSESVE